MQVIPLTPGKIQENVAVSVFNNIEIFYVKITHLVFSTYHIMIKRQQVMRIED